VNLQRNHVSGTKHRHQTRSTPSKLSPPEKMKMRDLTNQFYPLRNKNTATDNTDEVLDHIISATPVETEVDHETDCDEHIQDMEWPTVTTRPKSPPLNATVGTAEAAINFGMAGYNLTQYIKGNTGSIIAAARKNPFSFNVISKPNRPAGECETPV
jgi:hypothetical protein